MRSIRRRDRHRISSALLLVFLAAARPAPGQTRSTPALPESIEKGTIELAAIGGLTLPVSWLRARSDRRITMASIDVGRFMTGQLGQGPLSGQFEFLLEMTPLFIVDQPPTTVGVAVSPLHTRWNFGPFGSIRPFAEASGGMVYTGKPVPSRATTTFNFIDQAGFGVRIGGRRAWVAGYRFQHISNAGRQEPNPGANFNLAYVGVTFLR